MEELEVRSVRDLHDGHRSNQWFNLRSDAVVENDDGLRASAGDPSGNAKGEALEHVQLGSFEADRSHMLGDDHSATPETAEEQRENRRRIGKSVNVYCR